MALLYAQREQPHVIGRLSVSNRGGAALTIGRVLRLISFVVEICDFVRCEDLDGMLAAEIEISVL